MICLERPRAHEGTSRRGALPRVNVAVIGAGMAGMATAARLQAAGLSTVVLESHGQPGGCAGYFRRRGFAFDVGATTLVDFDPDGVGGELLRTIEMGPLEADRLQGYRAWLPDRSVALYRDGGAWASERLQKLGDTPAHCRFWKLMDRLTRTFWTASRLGIRLPIRRVGELIRAARILRVRDWPLARYVTWTMGDLLNKLRLEGDRPLVGLLSILLEDTVHSTIARAPLINAALGTTIRGAGLTRARGGMWGFWRAFTARYRALGGTLRLACPVRRVEGIEGGYLLHTPVGPFRVDQVVSAVPIEITNRIAPAPVREALGPHLERNKGARGGAIVVFLGVPEDEVEGRDFTHHQLLQTYDAPLGNGNNMFISVSEPGDTKSAPPGHRAVMISTHCELSPWQGLSDGEYECRKRDMAMHLVGLARRVYPRLGCGALVTEVGTPRTYERFTSRPGGAVGGFRLSTANANQRAVPHDIGVPGFWLAGDTTWPGLGTVACILGSRIVAEGILAGIGKQIHVG